MLTGEGERKLKERRAARGRYAAGMPSGWPTLPAYDRVERDLRHAARAHAGAGKLAVALAPPEPELQHAALRLSARGWETSPLPAPDGSGAFVAALDLRAHEALVEHSDGRARRVALAPDRSVGEVTRELLARSASSPGRSRSTRRRRRSPGACRSTRTRNTAYDPEQVERYFAAATQAALVLAAFRAPYRGRSTPVNAWWGSFDLAVNLFSGHPADPPSQDFIMRNAMDAQEVAVGWWPGDARYEHAAFYAYAHPAPRASPTATLSPAAARWEAELGEYVLDWDDVCPARAACDGAGVRTLGLPPRVLVCDWDPDARRERRGDPPPVIYRRGFIFDHSALCTRLAAW